MVGRIIGKGGETIMRLQAQSGAKIVMSKGVEPHTVSVRGSSETVACAINMISTLLDDSERSEAGLVEGTVERSIEVSRARIGRVLGKGGATINGLQRDSGA